MSALLEAVFGTEPPDEAFERFCRVELGSGIREVVFERASAGIVRALELEDGRRVVVKAHQPGRDESFLTAVREVQAFLHAAGYPVPLPLGGPAPLGRGLGLAQEFRDEGSWENAHRPEIRRELARSLATQLELTRSLGAVIGLGRGWRLWAGAGLWPPAAHSPIFDFAATAARAERIDELAARGKRLVGAGRPLVGHSDWSAKHMRFVSGEISVIYDWDSLDLSTETKLVGTAAATFTANYELDVPYAPTPDEARAFVDAYSAARSSRLSRSEREEIAAVTLYVVAYSARCAHALGRRGDFVEALERFGVEFLSP
ncbi:MAG: phosphotransferase [Actinobacteria bacterium]|nr:phosphotransferase [Actinomycetota bacterium]